MALRPYVRQEGINGNAPNVDYSAPQVDGSVGQTFRQVGRSLLDTAEPVLEKRATEKGREAGAKAPLIRDEKGILRRAPLPAEGGLVYGEAYRRAMNELYKGRLLTNAEIQYEDIKKRNYDNPQQALIEMQAHAEAVSATIPDDIKAEIEPDLFREAIQRFNGLNVAKIERDNRQALSELELQYKGLEKKAYGDLTRLAEAQDWDAYDALLKEYIGKLDANQISRKGIANGLTPIGEEGEDMMFLDNIADIDAEVVATKGVLKLIRNGKDLVKDRTALELMVAWRIGDDSAGEGRVASMSYDDYVKYLPTQRGREKAATWAAEQIRTLDEQAALQATAAKEEEKRQEDQAKRESIAVLGSMALSNPEFFKLWDSDFNANVLAKAPNINTFMVDEENRNWAVAQVGHGGRLPTALKTWLTQQASGDHAQLVVDVAEKLLGKRHPQTGVYTGVQAWRELSTDTQALVARYREMSDMEIPTGQRRAILNDIVTGKWRVRSAASAFKDEEGKPSQQLYVETRDRYIRTIFGTDPAKLPAKISETIEGSVKSFLAVYGDDRETAVRKAVESVATLWSPHPIGAQGFIPTELKGLNLTPSQLDYLFGNFDQKTQRFVTPGGAGFTQLTRPVNGVKLPRARITLTDDSQLPAGVGNYRIDYYDVDGNWIGNRDNVNIDDLLSRYYGGVAAFENKMRGARRAAAKANRDAYQQRLKQTSRQQLRRIGRDY